MTGTIRRVLKEMQYYTFHIHSKKREIYTYKMINKTERYLWLQDTINGLLNISLKDMSFCELFIPMSGQPNSGQGALFGQHKMCVKHGGLFLKIEEKYL